MPLPQFLCCYTDWSDQLCSHTELSLTVDLLSVREQHKASLKDILQYSPFKTQAELLTEIGAINSTCSTGTTGTRIIIWNLRKSVCLSVFSWIFVSLSFSFVVFPSYSLIHPHPPISLINPLIVVIPTQSMLYSPSREMSNDKCCGM